MTRLLVSALSTGGIRSSISKGVSDLLERCGASASGNVLDQCAATPHFILWPASSPASTSGASEPCSTPAVGLQQPSERHALRTRHQAAHLWTCPSSGRSFATTAEASNADAAVQPSPAGTQGVEASNRLSSLQPFKEEVHPVQPNLSIPVELRHELTRNEFTLRRYRLPNQMGLDPASSWNSSSSSTTSQQGPGVKQGMPSKTQKAKATDDSDHHQLMLEAGFQIVKTLQSRGHLAYIAGGWVRDALLGRPGVDVDIATSASVMEQLPLIFPPPKFSIAQLPRATARLTTLPKSGFKGSFTFEIAEFRGHQREATLQSAYMDAHLRDFTINSLFYDPVSGELLDFTGGVMHLQQKVLAIPTYHLAQVTSKVIEDDPIRILRAVRFACNLGLTIEQRTVAALKRHAYRCTFSEQGAASVGIRRMHKEIQKLRLLEASVGTPALASALALMHDVGVMQSLFKELFQPSAGQKPLSSQDMLALQSALPPGTPLELRLASTVYPWGADQAHSDEQLTNLIDTLERGSRQEAALLGWDTSLVLAALSAKQVAWELHRPVPGGGYQAYHALLHGKLKQDLGLTSLKANLIQVLAHPHWPSLQAWLVHWFWDSAVDPETGEVYNPKLELPLVFESLRKLWSSEIAEAQRLQQTRLPEQLLQQQAAAKPPGMYPVQLHPATRQSKPR